MFFFKQMYEYNIYIFKILIFLRLKLIAVCNERLRKKERRENNFY